ncbi:hypothetical protein BU14_0254s0021 [Porphyra umbilicalis]|uniref:Transmembrane protein n=1 Tax=Porphyra umbilicalis TaxID=2786 RepID=A0A1X6P2Q5_PORUM|nr:hypothetical protein BU14_0254s0021 [Porphyra umbilicalis]|eukprot:OSX75141.1 hypothetical protein BU14_0254s0021 [Porphyra umbilicalis]
MAIELLSVAPHSGVLTPYADLVLVELFLTVASIIVFGATLDQANRQDTCSGSCVYPIVAVVFFSVVVGCLFGRHALMAVSPSGRLQAGRPGMRTSPRLWTFWAEQKLLLALLVWWTPALALLSTVRAAPGGGRDPDGGLATVEATSGSGLVFGWLMFLGCVRGVYCAWRVMAEQAAEDRRIEEAEEEARVRATEEEGTYANFS